MRGTPSIKFLTAATVAFGAWLQTLAPVLAHEGEVHVAAGSGAAMFLMPLALVFAALLVAASFLLMASAKRGFGSRGGAATAADRRPLRGSASREPGA